MQTFQRLVYLWVVGRSLGSHTPLVGRKSIHLKVESFGHQHMRFPKHTCWRVRRVTFVQLAQIGKGCVVGVGLESFWGVGWVFTFLELSHMSKAMEAGSEQTGKKDKKG